MDDPADLRCGNRVLHQGTGNQSDLYFCKYHNKNPERHKADPADLDQSEDHCLTKRRPVCIGIELDQSGHTGSACSGKKSCEKVGVFRISRCDRKTEQQRADQDNGSISDQYDFHRRELEQPTPKIVYRYNKNHLFGLFSNGIYNIKDLT